MNIEEMRVILEKLKEISLQAGILLKQYLNTSFKISFKGEIDLVTDADRASEKLIVDFLKRHFGDFGIIAEEGSSSKGESDYYFLIDPLDGTTNFSHKYPFFAVSIGLMHKKTPILGVVYNPISGELFYATKGGGAYLNGDRIHVSSTTKLKQALLVTGFAYKIEVFDNIPYFNRMIKMARGIRRDGAATLDFCYVACGRYDGFWELGLNPWDQAAGAIILEEAGGQITTMDGGDWDPYIKGVVATNGHLHNIILDALNQ